MRKQTEDNDTTTATVIKSKDDIPETGRAEYSGLEEMSIDVTVRRNWLFGRKLLRNFAGDLKMSKLNPIALTYPRLLPTKHAKWDARRSSIPNAVLAVSSKVCTT
jgi:hypothetical protein